MFTKRIIPCLDVNNGRVVKGVNFVNLRDAGDPVEIAAAYDKAGADELVFLDITATSDARETVVDMVRKVAEKVFIPFTVGGGIRTVDDFKALQITAVTPKVILQVSLQMPFYHFHSHLQLLQPFFHSSASLTGSYPHLYSLPLYIFSPYLKES